MTIHVRAVGKSQPDTYEDARFTIEENGTLAIVGPDRTITSAYAPGSWIQVTKN